MIKTIIGLIATIFIVLTIYMYINPEKREYYNTQIVQKTVLNSQQKNKQIATQHKREKHIVGNVEENDIMNEVVASHKNIEIVDNVESGNEIGKGLTLEDIENVDVSDEEKERMKMDFLYHQSSQMKDEPSLNGEEIQNMIENDLKNGLF